MLTVFAEPPKKEDNFQIGYAMSTNYMGCICLLMSVC